MKSYLELDIKVQGALKFDPKQLVLDNPQQPTPKCRTEMWIPDAGGVWYFDSDEIFNKDW